MRATRTLLALAGLTAAAIAQPCAAQPFQVRQVFSPNPAWVIRQTTVPIAGLDRFSIPDARILLTRVQAAADAVCDVRVNGMDERTHASRFADCRRGAVASAVRKMRSPPLSAMAAADRHLEMAAR